MSSILIACIVGATLCVERGLMHITLIVQKKMIERMERKINRNQIPTLAQLAVASPTEKEREEMKQWIKHTQALVGGIDDVIKIHGNNVENWTTIDILLVSQRLLAFERIGK